MNWVKLTRPDRTAVWLNLDRFDTATLDELEDGEPITRLIATLSDIEEDVLCVNVLEAPEQFLLR